MRVLVTGASGYIGSRLVPALLKAGHQVRCLSRAPERLRVPAGVERVQGDALEPATLGPALAGIDAVYYLIHSMENARGDARSFAERDRQAARHLAGAAAAAGVKRIIYLGGLGETGGALSAHLASRLEVGRILNAGPVPVTTFRAAIIVGAGGSSFEMVKALVERLPVMICPRWVDTPCQPIALADVITYLVHALSAPETAGRSFDIGGPDVLTYREMMLGLARVLGLRRLIVRVPVLTPRLSSYWVQLVTPVPASLARPLIDGLKNPVVCRDTAIQQVLPHACLPYEASLHAALDAQGRGTITREGDGYRLSWRQTVDAPADAVMDVFANPQNLLAITPPWVRLALVPPVPARLEQGSTLRYRLRILGMPLRWESVITSWYPPRSFRDEARSGPYRRWIHTHRFDTAGGRTVIIDDVDYALPLGAVGRLANPLIVAWQLRAIFAYRGRHLPKLLAVGPR